MAHPALKAMVEMTKYPAYCCVRYYAKQHDIVLSNCDVEVTPDASTHTEKIGDTFCIQIGLLTVDQVLRLFGDPDPDSWYDIIKFIIIHEYAHVIRDDLPWKADEDEANELAFAIIKETSDMSDSAEAFIRKTFLGKKKNA